MSRQFDLPPSEIESWIDQTKAGMENTLEGQNGKTSAKMYEAQLKALQKAYGEAMLELRAQKMGRPAGQEGRDMIL